MKGLVGGVLVSALMPFSRNRGYNLCLPMPHFLKPVLLWTIDALPDISNLILVLVGVIMSLPKLAERIEAYAVARYILAVGCVALGLCGFIVSVNQRRQAKDDEHTLVGNTNTLVTMVSVMLPQISAANDGVATLKTALHDAEGRRDSNAVASLRSKLAEAQKQSDDATRQLAIKLEPKVSAQLQQVQGAKDGAIYNIGFYRDHEGMPGETAAQRAEIEAKIVRDTQGVIRVFEQDVQSLLPTVRYLAEAMTHGHQTDDDLREIGSIDAYLSGKQSLRGGVAMELSKYLDATVKRFTNLPPTVKSVTVN